MAPSRVDADSVAGSRSGRSLASSRSSARRARLRHLEDFDPTDQEAINRLTGTLGQGTDPDIVAARLVRLGMSDTEARNFIQSQIVRNGRTAEAARHFDRLSLDGSSGDDLAHDVFEGAKRHRGGATMEDRRQRKETALRELFPELEVGRPLFADAYLEKTRQKVSRMRGLDTDTIISYLRSSAGDRLSTPLPSSLWKHVLLDEYMPFDKIQGLLLSNFSPNEDAGRSLTDDLVIMRRDAVVPSSAVILESDWSRCFEVWREAMLVVFPHRREELESYKAKILQIFFNYRNLSSVAIEVDENLRSSYRHLPFHLDNQVRIDNEVATVLAQRLNSQLGAASRSSNPRSGSGQGASQGSSRPVRSTACFKWNESACAEDPCPWGHRHVCCECGGAHRAPDHAACAVKYAARSNKRKKKPTGRTA